MNAILLAKGEKSKRLGMDKAFIKINGQPIVEIILNKIKSLFKKIYIVSLFPEKFKRYENKKIKLLKDTLKCGPLGGIYIGIMNSKSLYNFIFACDMPYIDVNFIKYMKKIKKNYDVLVPVHNKRLEVLHAIYNKKILGVIKHLIKKKKYKITSLFKKVRLKYIKEDKIRKNWVPEIIFFNINTTKDLKKILNYEVSLF